MTIQLQSLQSGAQTYWQLNNMFEVLVSREIMRIIIQLFVASHSDCRKCTCVLGAASGMTVWLLQFFVVFSTVSDNTCFLDPRPDIIPPCNQGIIIALCWPMMTNDDPGLTNFIRYCLMHFWLAQIADLIWCWLSGNTVAAVHYFIS